MGRGALPDALPSTAKALTSYHLPVEPNAAAVLMYHRIAELRPDAHQLCTPPARFRDQLAAVASRFRVLPLVELWDAAERGERAVAITLDDGTVDALVAAEILDELGLTATFFVTTAHLDERHEHWWDTFERLSLPEAERPRFLRAGGPARTALLDEAIARSGRVLPARETHRCLLGSEVCALARRHAIGAHGVDHLQLPSLSAEAQRQELGASKHTLEERLGRAVTELAYPYGAYDEPAIEAARALGFRCAVTVEERALRAGDDRLRTPRLDGQRQDPAELIGRLEGWFGSDQNSV